MFLQTIFVLWQFLKIALQVVCGIFRSCLMFVKNLMLPTRILHPTANCFVIGYHERDGIPPIVG